MASNPVLRGFEKTGRPGVGQAAPAGPVVPPPPSAGQLNEWYAQPAFGQEAAAPKAAAPSRYLTLDDVVTRTALLIGAVLLAAAVAWFLPESTRGPLLAIGFIGGFGLGLFIAFTGKATAATTIAYSVFEGLALGAISKVFNDQFNGIVVQAVTGTIMVAGGVLIVYKTGAVRVTPKFTKIVFAATLGVLGLVIVNAVASIFVDGGLGLRGGGNSNIGLAVAFSLLCIVIAAANLIVDFDMVEQSVRRGVDEKFGWYLSFGILVTLVWLYLEILRLLSYFAGGSRN